MSSSSRQAGRIANVLGQHVACWTSPGVTRVMLPAQLARIQVAVEPLVIFLLITSTTKSYALGGIALGAYSLTVAVAWPVQGRLIDRFGARWVVAVAALMHSAALVTILVLINATGGTSRWAVLACVIGLAATLPPIGSIVRALWARLLEDGPQLDAAYSLEAILVEIVFIAGPMLAGLSVKLWGATWSLAGWGLLMLLACIGLAAAPESTPSTHRHEERHHQAAPLWRNRGALAVLVAIALGSAGVATLEVAIPATTAAYSDEGLGVMLLSFISAGAVVGGLWHGLSERLREQVVRYVALLTAMTVLMVPQVFCVTAAALAAGLFVAGLPCAAASSEEYGILGRLAPRSSLTETFAWAGTMVAVGSAFGSFAAGFIVTSAGASWGRALAPIIIAPAALIVWLNRDALRLANDPEPDVLPASLALTVAEDVHVG